mgnify:CR=1 FL=1
MGKGVTVVIGGKTYELVFTLNALMAFSARFGGRDEMIEQTQGPQIYESDPPEVVEEKRKAQKKAQERFFQELPWLIATLANQGIALANLQHKGKVENLTPDLVGLLVMPSEFYKLAGDVMEAMLIGSTPEHVAEEEDQPKDAFLEELESKNAGGAAE